MKESLTKDILLIKLTNESCDNCDEIASEAMASPLVAMRLKDYDCITVPYESELGNSITWTYWLDTRVGLVALNKDLSYLLHLSGTTNNPLVYLDFLDKVEATTEPPFGVRNGLLRVRNILSLDELEQLLLKMEEYKLNTEIILSRYAKRIPIGYIYNADSLQFLFERAPLIGSDAYDILHYNMTTNRQLYARNQKNGIANRVNNKIIVKSRKRAIWNRNFSYMKRVARFAEDTWDKDEYRGRATYLYNLAEYGYRIRDTSIFDDYATQYYDHFYKNMNIDSIRREEIGAAELRSMSPARSQSHHMNILAWKIYEISTDQNLLLRGRELSAASLKFYRDPAYLDTYAHLLYRTGQRKEAIKYQEEAIERLRLIGVVPIPENFTMSLKKMKDGTL